MFSPQKKLLSCGFEYENVASFLRHFSFSKHFFRLIGYIKEESHETKNKKKKTTLSPSILHHVSQRSWYTQSTEEAEYRFLLILREYFLCFQHFIRYADNRNGARKYVV